jgi:hypothetical protein
MAKKLKKKSSELRDTYNRAGERILEGRTLNEWAAQYCNGITADGWTSKTLRARRKFDALLLQIQKDRAMDNLSPLDRNSIAGIFDADTYFVAYETTLDYTINEKAKASHDALEVSTTLNAYDPLILYSTSSNATRSDATTCRKRNLSALQDASNSSCCSKDRGCSLASPTFANLI